MPFYSSDPLEAAEEKADHFYYQYNCNLSYLVDGAYFVWVFGGPGAGKSTLCDKITKDHDFADLKPSHFALNDLLRQSASDGSLSQSKKLTEAYLQHKPLEGQRLLIWLIEQIFDEYNHKGSRLFLIDGYPRTREQADEYFNSGLTIIAPVLIHSDEISSYIGFVSADVSANPEHKADQTWEEYQRRCTEFEENIHDTVAPFGDRLVQIDMRNGKGPKDVYEELKANIKQRLPPNPVKGLDRY